MDLNVAVRTASELFDDNDLIFPVSMGRENLKILASPGSESSGVSSLDAEESKVSTHHKEAQTMEKMNVIFYRHTAQLISKCVEIIKTTTITNEKKAEREQNVTIYLFVEINRGNNGHQYY